MGRWRFQNEYSSSSDDEEDEQQPSWEFQDFPFKPKPNHHHGAQPLVEQEPLENLLNKLEIEEEYDDDEMKPQQQQQDDKKETRIIKPRVMGQGSGGVVFACKLHWHDYNENDLVVKLPRELFRLGFLQIKQNTHDDDNVIKKNYDPTTIEYLLQQQDVDNNEDDQNIWQEGLRIVKVDPETVDIPIHENPDGLSNKEMYEKVLKQEQSSFLKEMRNFETIHDTPTQRTNAWGQIEVAQRMNNLNRKHFEQMKKEAAQIEVHMGHRHILPILHLDYSIPAIISQRCTGNLMNLRLENPFAFRSNNDINDFSLLWRNIAAQLGIAIDFILSRGLAHVDIKPENIFYEWGNEGEIFVLVGDFGKCEPVGDKLYSHKNWDKMPRGTRRYMPKMLYRMQSVLPPDTKLDYYVLNPIKLSLFQYAATMVSLIYLKEAMPDWPSILHEPTTPNFIEDDINTIKQNTAWGAEMFATTTIQEPAWDSLTKLIYRWKTDTPDQMVANFQQFIELQVRHIFSR